MQNHVNSEYIAMLYIRTITYLPFGGLLPRSGPDGLPVLLGQLGLLVLLVKLAFVTLIS